MRLYIFLSVASTLSALKPTRAAPHLSAFAFSSNASFLARQESAGIHAQRTSSISRTMTTDRSSDSVKDEAKAAPPVDPEYPGTAVERMINIRERVQQLAQGDDLNQKWQDVRRKILWAGGLRDLPDAAPGQGYTGHSFNDWNHCDLTAMVPVDSTNDGQVQGIAQGNFLGAGIRVASLPELGPGGSWSTCLMGCNKDPPADVAHIQFQSRIAFKLVWVPNDKFDSFVLVDDDGKLLAQGTPSDGPGGLPNLRERQINYQMVAGSKYAQEADAIAKQTS